MKTKFPDYKLYQAKKKLRQDIQTVLIEVMSSARHPAIKEMIQRYIQMLDNPHVLLPLGGFTKVPRANQPDKLLCIYALITALITEWRNYSERPETGATVAYKYITELRNVTIHGEGNYSLLGNLTEGFYLILL